MVGKGFCLDTSQKGRASLDESGLISTEAEHFDMKKEMYAGGDEGERDEGAVCTAALLLDAWS